MGLIRKLHIGQGFSLNYQDIKVDVVFVDDYPQEAIFEINDQNDQNIPPVAIPYGSSYRFESFPETTFVPSRNNGQTIVNITAPSKVYIHIFP